ncbi:MAG: eukaryotic-like serine/threonine-protein kinase [Chthoniobacter sp.]|jgi:hypothetical protein|nr:eukaryotic-like serine/threonine-protein kinase [Chthoniobacter sp.]
MNPVDPAPEAEAESPLLQACGTCGGLIDISDEEPLSRMTCPMCGAPELVSGRVDKFELVEVVGSGGMGVVYKAYDAGLDRYLALKLLRRDKGTNYQVVEQLEKEASITASINHPHVVRVFTSGTDHGRFYIAMELVDKGTLDDLIKLQGRVSEAQVLQVGIQIAQGLRAALQAGLIHRDVKPGNILFADAHTAKIVDFGLAIFMEDEEKMRGEVWGTPYYVAPEKLEHQPEDFRSDIYSLGGTLFHALAGRPPFEAEDASMVALKHLKSQAVSLQAFAPQVSSQTAYVINRTLLKDPNDRYQSYDELIEHLEYALEQLNEKGAQPQQRVVLEGEQQQKALGWVTASMFGIILLLAIAAFAFRDRLFKEEKRGAVPTPNAAGAPVKSEGPFAEAQTRLIEGETARAIELFREEANNKKRTPTEVAWARLGEGLAQLIAGKPAEAQTAFQAILERKAAAAKDEKLDAFLGDIARKMASPLPISPAEGRGYNQTNYEAVAPLLFALKNWHLGRVEEATAYFTEFRRTEPTERDAWIGKLKRPLVADYMEKYEAFLMAANAAKTAKKTEDRTKALEKIRKLGGPFEAKFAELEKSIPVPRPPPPLPKLGDWSQTALGELKVPPSATRDASGVFTIKASGIDLWGNADNGHFIYRTLEGDGEIVARVVSIEKGDPWAKVGVMARESNKPESRNAALLLTPGNGLTQQTRPTNGGLTTSEKGKVPGTLPQWLKLVRQGDTVTGYRSADGQNWEPLAVRKLDKLPRNIQLGLAVASHADAAVTAKIDNVSLAPLR